MAKVALKSVKKAYSTTIIIPELDLEIASGEFLALVGPSGCGKSTILRMVAGLDQPTSGSISIDGAIVNEVRPQDRGIAMVFQNYALYPHMTVRENLAFPLKMANLEAKEISHRIEEASQILGLSQLLDRKPAQLSGGQKQRVAMGRAIVRRPKVLLFDEPLSNLDAQLRGKVRAEIAQLHKRYHSTVLYVTHDQVEAMTLADRIAVLNKGNLEQLGRPMEIYHSPKSQFVASFVGMPPMNFLPTHALGAQNFAPSATSIGFRPEALSLAGDSSQYPLGTGKVSLIEPLGSTTYVHLDLAGQSVILETKQSSIHMDQEIPLWVEKKSVFLFASDGRSLGKGL